MTFNQIFKNKLFTAAVIVCAVFGLVLAWQIYAPKSFNSEKEILFNVEKGMGGEATAAELQGQGVIKNAWAFKIYAFITGQAKNLQAGLYEFSPGMSVASIVNALGSGKIATQKLTIPEGWNVKEIGTYLEGKGFYAKDDFLILMKADLSEEFAVLKNKPQTVDLEGYLFPDTYTVPLGTSTEDVVRLMLKNFDNRLTPELRAEIAAQKRSIFQIVTMASLLEKEANTETDKKIIAGILWKRITAGMPLQVDATVNYVTGKAVVRSSLADTRVDSPYNTYKYYGLPKGPIANPGMESILAAIYPQKTEFWYYLTSSDGQMVYSKTFQEHSIAISKYLD